ncbi:response regulator [Sphingomonas sp. VDB2]|uniref:response regulator n=1 Tax=Sphingomonas sp. VDB2 TaxID=3228751 RepID=UPI003A812943
MQTCSSFCSYRLHLLRSWSLRQTRYGSHRGQHPYRGGYDQVGEFASQSLGDLGFTTRRAANAREALVILEREHHDIDILFSDVIMPGIDGVELARQVRERWPDLIIVLTSGYSHVLADDARHGFALLHKPYSVDELSRVLRDARWANSR